MTTKPKSGPAWPGRAQRDLVHAEQMADDAVYLDIAAGRLQAALGGSQEDDRDAAEVVDAVVSTLELCRRALERVPTRFAEDARAALEQYAPGKS